MEDRCPIHYDRNTVIGPHPGKKSVEVRTGQPLGEIISKEKTPQNNEPKVCAAISCVWCGEKFDDYQVVCRRCFSCQYCGLLASSLFGCHLCGNSLPEELRQPAQDRVIRIH